MMVLAVVSPLVFAGCAAPVTSDPVVSTVSAPSLATDRVVESTTAPVPTPVDPVSDEEFAGSIISIVAEDEGIQIPASMAGEYATIICEGFADGLSPLVMVRIGVEELPRWSSDEHSFLMGASVGALCPEFASKIVGN